MNPWIEGIDYYVNQDGLVVMTAAYLLKRGYCCGRGCRHCPYDYQNVPEPEKTAFQLLQKARDKNPPDH